MAETKSASKLAGIKRLKALLPKKRNYIIVLPDEIEEGLHWTFWLLTGLVVILLISVVVINFTDLPKTLSLLF